MVRSSRVPPPTAVAAASPSPSLSVPSSLPSLFHQHPPQGPSGSTADLGRSNNPRGLLEGWSLPERPHTRQAGESSRTSRGPHRRTSSFVSTNTTITRSSSVDLGRRPTITTATTAVHVRPVLHVNPKSVARTSHSVSSSPQRRNPQPSTSSATTTPSTAVSTDSYLYWKQVPALPAAPSLPPILPDLNIPRPESDDFSKIPGITTSPLLPPYHEESAPPKHVETEPTPPPPRVQPNSSRPSHVRARSRNKSQSQKAMLGSALEKAHTAVTLDNAGNLEGAMEAYQDACALLSQVLNRAGGDNERLKLQAIKDAYMERMNEIRAMPPPPHKEYERSLPPRPVTEEFTDDASLYTVEDNESTLMPTAAPSIGDRYGSPIRTTVPPRRDSLYTSPNGGAREERSPPRLAMARNIMAHNFVPIPLSPVRSIRSPVLEPVLEPDHDIGLDMGLGQSLPVPGSKESFTFGAAALSPRFSPRKAADYGIQRSSSGASSRSSRSLMQSHSRQASEEVSTSWLNTIDESGSSVGEPSPLWNRKSIGPPDEPVDNLDDDFDAQLDAAVEAAYDEGYVVGYPFDDADLMPQGPRQNAESAKERVRQVELEMELEIRNERERRLRIERERMLTKAKRELDVDFYDDADEDEDDEDDESEEERMMVEEMTRGYTLDFDFDRDAKTALPRESISTQYSDGTVARGSSSSGYSSGTTWNSGHNTTSMFLTTVDETPTTPPPLPPPPVPPEDLEHRDIGPSPTKPPPPPPPSNGIKHTLIAPGLAITEPAGITPGIHLTQPTGVAPGLAVNKPVGVRGRRLSNLSEPVEPLTIETSSTSKLATIDTKQVPTTVVQGPSPLFTAATEQPPLPPIQPLSIPPKSPSYIASRPGTSHDQDTDTDAPLTMKGSRPLSPPVHEHSGLSATPLQKTLSSESATASGSESPARIGYTPKIPGIPSLRQIQSSASLRSRNLISPDFDPPSTPKSGLFSSSSTSNLRKGFPRSGTPAGVPMTPLYPPPTAGLSGSGMDLFDSKIHSPTMPTNDADRSAPAPLEPCPPEPLSRPFWLMRCLYQTIAHPRGGYVSTKLFVPREVWYIKGVKIKAIDDKINACDLVTAALQRLANVKQEQVNSVFEEMQALEGVLDRAQTVLSKKLGNEVGGIGAKSLYGDSSTSESNDNMVTTKVGNTGGSGKYFSLRKLRTKASSNGLGSTFGSSPSGSNGDSSYSGLPMAGAGANASLQPKRNIDQVAFGGPHANYIAALAKLFDAAQILDRLAVFGDVTMPQKVPIKLRIGLELSHRHAAEFFGFYICRFVLSDVTLLLDKFVKRGGEWVSQ